MYQYRGKLGSPVEIGLQVTEESFVTSTRQRPTSNSIQKTRQFQAKQINTGDIIDHLKISTLTKDELMSTSSLTKTNDPDRTFIFTPNTWNRKRKVLNTDFQIDTQMNFKNLESKR